MIQKTAKMLTLPEQTKKKLYDIALDAHGAKRDVFGIPVMRRRYLVSELIAHFSTANHETPPDNSVYAASFIFECMNPATTLKTFTRTELCKILAPESNVFDYKAAINAADKFAEIEQRDIREHPMLVNGASPDEREIFLAGYIATARLAHQMNIVLPTTYFDTMRRVAETAGDSNECFYISACEETGTTVDPRIICRARNAPLPVAFRENMTALLK